VQWCSGAQIGNYCIISASSIFSEPRAADLHSKFALHHAWKYGRHPFCDHWE